ncbi:MAG: glutamate ligase domain-containing protein [Planctomycetota bacterium]
MVILNAGDEECRRMGERAAPGVRRVWFGAGEAPPVPLETMALRGAHNRENAAAAAHAALAAGASPGGCTAALARFRPLPHRMETLETADGILWVNDSIATTPIAVERAIQSFTEPVILIAGGRPKGLDLRPLVEAGRRARAVVAFGEAGPDLAAALPATRLRTDLRGAVREARRLARPGDVVLLSPGFASYDQFSGFDERGELFREIVGGAL